MKRPLFKRALVAVAALSIGLPASSALAGKYTEGAVSGGGKIAGKVVWKGAPPDSAPFQITKDPKVCDPDGKGTKPSPRVQVAAGGGLANAVVYLEKIDAGKPFPDAMKSPELDQQICEYVPHVMVAKRKSKLVLKSGDDVMHNVHMYGVASYNLPIIAGKTIKKPLRKPGVIEIGCDAGHGWMSAFIHVVDHPYYAITDASGAFELDEVPPGKYTLKAWHEGWKIKEKVKKDGVVVRHVFSDPIGVSQPVEVVGGGTADVTIELK